MKYILRSVKYLLLLFALLVALTLLFNSSSDVELSYSEHFAFFMADNGAMKLAFFVVLAALYPLFGYVKRYVLGLVEDNKGQIDIALQAAGFMFRKECDGKLYYGADTFFRRASFLFEDEIVVEQCGEYIRIEGSRRAVVYAAYCLHGFIKNSQRGE